MSTRTHQEPWSRALPVEMRMTLRRLRIVGLVMSVLFMPACGSSSKGPTALVESVYAMLEEGDSGGALLALEELTSTFGESSDSQVQVVVARTLYNAGTALYGSRHFDEALGPLEELRLRYGGSSNPDIRADVADGSFNEALALHELGRHEEEFSVFEDVANRFADSDDPYLRVQVARALNNKAIAMYELGYTNEDQLAVFIEVLDRFGDSTDPDMMPHLARASFSEGYVLDEMGMPEAARTAYERTVDWFKDSADPNVAVFVGAAKAGLSG